MNQFSGIDQVSAAIYGGATAIIAIVVYYSVPTLVRPFLPMISVVAVVLAIGNRFRVCIGSRGISLTLFAAWIIPIRRLRYLLDALICSTCTQNATRKGAFVNL